MLHQLARLLQFKHILSTLGLVVLSLVLVFGYLSWRDLDSRKTTHADYKNSLIQQQKQLLQTKAESLLNSIAYESSRSEHQLKQRIIDEVNSAHLIATGIYTNLAGTLADDEIKHTIIETLRKVRFFNNRGYLFINDLAGYSLLMPPTPEREGLLELKQQDDNGVFPTKELIKAATSSTQEGFARYRWYMPKEAGRPLRDKLSFAKQFTPFKWLIGTGDYLHLLEQDIQQKTLERFSQLTLAPFSFIAILDKHGATLASVGLTNDSFKLTKTSQINLQQALNSAQTSFNSDDFAAEQTNYAKTITYVTSEPHWQWSIIAGYYPEKLELALTETLNQQTFNQKSQFNNLLLGLSVISIVILICAILAAFWLSRTFNQYKAEHYKQRASLLKNKAELELSARVFDSTTEGIIITDEKNNIITCNSAFTRITGYSAAESYGKNPSFFSSGQTLPEVYLDMWHALQKHDHWQGEVINKHKEGHYFPEWLSINVYRNNSGAIVNYIGTISDITARKKAQARLEQLAHFDSLTGLANRRQLDNFITHSINQKTQIAPATPFSVFFMDLDNFKFINDSLGHAIGDSVLKETAKRLLHCVSTDDLVCRLGGDEFVVILKHIQGIAHIENIGQSIINAIGQPLDMAGKTLTVTPSIGICQFPQDGENSDVLLKNADIALYLAKENGRNRLEFYTESLSKTVAERVSLESDLRNALALKQFELYYQPQIDLYDQTIVGCEALIRWHHPIRGMVSPDDFIPLAEETGLILDIGLWVLQEACRQMSLWEGDANTQFNLAINLSARQFTHQLTQQVTQILEQYNIAGQRITLEITESLLMKQPENAISILTELRRLGIKIALDDFGTGYSSLSYLKKFPLDKLKIDRNFILGLPHDLDDIAIIKSIVTTAKHFNLVTVAEGIENTEQAYFLEGIGCIEGQGYLYSKPVPAIDMSHKIHQNHIVKSRLVHS